MLVCELVKHLTLVTDMDMHMSIISFVLCDYFRSMTAYSLFFRDTQASIKSQNQQATFGEVSRIVATMWDSLEPHEKEVYMYMVTGNTR